MNTLTIRMPDDLADRLKNTAQSRGISINTLITEISVQALAAYDAETRFTLTAAEADMSVALNVFDRLDNNR